MSEPVLQITTSLPPSIDGVGHYSSRLGEQLRINGGLSSRFFVGGIEADAGTARGAVVSGAGDERLLSEFLEQPSSLVIVHYVGYGFSKKGCPFWLVRALERWRQRYPERRLSIFFHELTATGRMWQSAYWLTAVQRRLIKRLLNIANVALSSLEMNARILQSWERGETSKVVPALPVFSNCGEALDLVPYSEREGAAVVFGTPGRKSKIYADSGETLSETLMQLRVTKLYDIGPRCTGGCAPQGGSFHGVPVVQLGELPPQEISARLSHCRFGFLDYPPALLGKSGIFASLAAHGVCPVLTGEYPTLSQAMDGLRAGAHFVMPRARMSAAECESIGSAVFEWYQSHTTAVHGSFFRGLAADTQEGLGTNG